MSQYDLMLDLKLKGVTVTYTSWFSEIASYFEDFLMYKHDILGKMSQYDLMLDLKIKVCHYDIFHGSVTLPYILKTI